MAYRHTRAAPLDEASRNRLREIHERSIKELEDGLAPELRDELERLSLPFTDDVAPSDAELRIAHDPLIRAQVKGPGVLPRGLPCRVRLVPCPLRAICGSC